MRPGRPASRSRADSSRRGELSGVRAGAGPAWAVGSRQDRPARRRAPGAALIAGELDAVAGPSVEAESLRDLVRAREDLRGDLMSARHRVSKLLLRHDVRFAGTERNWTQPHLRWLATVRFAQPGTQAAFDDYRGAVEA